MRETNAQNNFLALLCSTVADAFDNQGLAVTIGYTFYHVCDQRPGQTVQGSVFLVVGRTGYGDHTVFNCNAQFRGKLLCNFALRSLYGNVIVFACYGYAGWDTDRLFTYS